MLRLARQALVQMKRLRRQSGTVWQIEGNYTATGGDGKVMAYSNVKKAELDGQGTIQEQKQREGDRLARYMTERPSTVIGAVSYDARSSTVSVVFNSGESYDYPNISLNMLKQWAYAPSMGGYFTRFVRPYFSFR